MLNFALKNLRVKKLQTLFVILSIMLSAGVAVLAWNVGTQIQDGITGTAAYYSCIIGPAGSKTQLAMNSMYFIEEPLGTIPYALMAELQQDSRVTQVIPFAMADSYNGYNIVGTTSAYLDGKPLRDGTMFSDDGTFEVVIGSTVARTCGLTVGATIYTNHSAAEEHTTPVIVTGILSETHTIFDTTVFTHLRTIWELHEHEAEEETGEHGHGELENMVCAFLVRTMNPAYAMTLTNDYDGRVFTARDGDSYALQAIEPMAVVRTVLNDTNTTRYVAYILCAIILLMNTVIIIIITLLNMVHSAKEISLMRLIGISMKKINLVYILQNSIIGLISVLLAFMLSRVCLVWMSGYVASMGVILDPRNVYLQEIILLAAIFMINVIPTIICTIVMSRNGNIA